MIGIKYSILVNSNLKKISSGDLLERLEIHKRLTKIMIESSLGKTAQAEHNFDEFKKVRKELVKREVVI